MILVDSCDSNSLYIIVHLSMIDTMIFFLMFISLPNANHTQLPDEGDNIYCFLAIVSVQLDGISDSDLCKAWLL